MDIELYCQKFYIPYVLLNKIACLVPNLSEPHHHPVNPEDVRSVASALVNFLNMDPNNTEVVSACVCERRCCDDGNKHAAKLLQLDVQTRVCTWVQ